MQLARERCEGAEPFILCTSNSKCVWWDGYDGQKAIVIDEFYGSWMRYSVLLRVLDGHPYRLDVKGAFTWANYDLVIITSNSPIGSWYKRDDISALLRRVTEVIDCDEPLYDDIPAAIPDDGGEPRRLGRMRVELFQALQREHHGVFAEHRREPAWHYTGDGTTTTTVPIMHDGEALAAVQAYGDTPPIDDEVDGIL